MGLHDALRRAVDSHAERGLDQGAKWLCEHLAGLKVELQRKDLTVPEPKEDSVMLGQTYFRCKEYQRAASVLDKSTSSLGIFLKFYSRFLAGEKRREEQAYESKGQQGKVTNPELPKLNKELSSLIASNLPYVDGFILYLHGVVLQNLNMKDQATDVLQKAVQKDPCLWSAWTELAVLAKDFEMAESFTTGIDDNYSWMCDMFLAYAALEMQFNQEGLERYGQMQKSFPNSTTVQSQIAVAHYNMRAFEEAQERFEKLLEIDPFRLDGIDTYSNILYVKESKAELSFLAHRATKIDKFRPETCCIVGNYYSLKFEHEKAVLYFNRALALDKTCLSAWTLMGHEYVEMKNIPAAIAAYRQAVETNARDYRAWYGLGQTYEILHMPFYAIYYYRQAAALRPQDARMWCAVAGCYERLGRYDEAIEAYKRAEADDKEGTALSKLAKIYELREDWDKAAHYYERDLERRDQEDIHDKASAEALLYLAKYFKKKNDVQLATDMCNRLLDHSGPEKDAAKILLGELRVMARPQTRSLTRAGLRESGS